MVLEKFFENAENITRLIQLILAPAVMISACAIMVGGLVGRFAAINDRLRLLNKERYELIAKFSDDSLSAERLSEIDGQIPGLEGRLHLSHNSVVLVYCAILTFLIDMFLIALAALTALGWIALTALIVFLIATGLIAVGIIFTLLEVYTSLNAITFEIKRVTKLMPLSVSPLKSGRE